MFTKLFNKLKREKYFFKKCINNSVKSFHPGEINYHLEIGRFGGFNVAYRTGTADVSVIEHSFENDIIFACIPEYKPKPDHTIIDIGAHIGTFALLAARKVPNGKVYAIEANGETFNYLYINKHLNYLDNLITHHLALSSNANGSITLYHAEGNWGDSITRKHFFATEMEKVTTTNLAQFMENNTINSCDLIKLNCEGAEFQIILTTPIYILKRIKSMLVFFHLDLIKGYDLEQINNYLISAGFKTRVHFKVKAGGKSKHRGWVVATK